MRSIQSTEIQERVIPMTMCGGPAHAGVRLLYDTNMRVYLSIFVVIYYEREREREREREVRPNDSIKSYKIVGVLLLLFYIFLIFKLFRNQIKIHVRRLVPLTHNTPLPIKESSH